MHPTAKRCLTWSVGLLVVGTALLAYGAEAYLALADRAGPNAEIGLEVVSFLLAWVRNTAFPLAAALVGAAVVIHTLSPQRGADEATADPER